MASGYITTRLRPIRAAFLVDPTNSDDICRAIELSTGLWGGSYNAIIPVYKRTPKNWESHKVKRQIQPADIIIGYLDGFDPDIVIPIGDCSKNTYQIGNRDLVQESELLGDVNKTGVLRHGVGFYELLDDFLQKELKYKRNDNLHVAIPDIIKDPYRMFLCGVFGALPEELRQIESNEQLSKKGIITVKPTINNFVDMWSADRIFPRHISTWSLEHQPLQEAILFICDATKTQDVIDFWNLRAAGNRVIPIPIQISTNENIKHLAREFVEENCQPYRDNPKIFHKSVIQKSRTLSDESVKAFCDSLNFEHCTKTNHAKYYLRFWYPRLWDSWARENTQQKIVHPYSCEHVCTIPTSETRLELRSINPKFDLFDGFSGEPRFANDLSFRFHSTKELMAEIIPEGTRELSSAVGRTGYHSWRFSKSGPVFMARSKDELIFLELPQAESVMTGWFLERGWKVSLSGPGRIATQLIKQLGGAYGTSWLAHKGIILLLGELEKEAGMPRQAIIGRLKKVISDDNLFFDSERFLEILLESNAIRLGAKIQCPICTRYNWFELNSLKYELLCHFCLSNFQPPLKSPQDIFWTYRAHGPFAGSTAQGSFTVLLTLKFLSGDLHRAITPLLSFTAEKKGKVLEADLTCLYKQSTWRESQINVVHAECKSFNRFEKKDGIRMRELAQEFLGSVLIFSTLNESLDTSEIKMISSIVRVEREKQLRGIPYSPIIVLTGIELFVSRSPLQCWKKRGELYEQLSNHGFDFSDLPKLADATQQLYLKLPSWHSWAEDQRNKRLLKNKVSKN